MTSKKTEKPEAPSEPQFTPAEYREKFCQVKAREKGGKSSDSVAFVVASVLYGWEAQAHHFGAESFKLTATEFEEALAAAMKYPCAKPFQAAVPPVSKDKFKNFTPKKANN